MYLLTVFVHLYALIALNNVVLKRQGVGLAAVASMQKAFVFCLVITVLNQFPATQNWLAQDEVRSVIAFMEVLFFGEIANYFVRRGFRNYDAASHDPLKLVMVGFAGPFTLMVAKKKMLMMLNSPFYMTLINIISSSYELSSRIFGVQKDRFYRKIFVCCRYRNDILARTTSVPLKLREVYVVNEMAQGLLDVALPTSMAAGFYITNFALTGSTPKTIRFWMFSLFLQYASELFADFVVSTFGAKKPYDAGREHLIERLPIFMTGYLVFLLFQLFFFIFFAGVAWAENSHGTCVTIARYPGSHW